MQSTSWWESRRDGAPSRAFGSPSTTHDQSVLVPPAIAPLLYISGVEDFVLDACRNGGRSGLEWQSNIGTLIELDGACLGDHEHIP